MTPLEEQALELYWEGWKLGWDNPHNLAISILALMFVPAEMVEGLIPYSRP